MRNTKSIGPGTRFLVSFGVPSHAYNNSAHHASIRVTARQIEEGVGQNTFFNDALKQALCLLKFNRHGGRKHGRTLPPGINGLVGTFNDIDIQLSMI